MIGPSPCSVVHLTRDYPPRLRGGISRAVRGWIESSSEGHLRHAVVSFDGFRPSRSGAEADALHLDLKPNAIPVARLSTSSSLHEAVAFAVSQEPEIVHVHDPLLWSVGLEIAGLTTARCVYSVHVHQAEMSRLRGLSESTMSETAERDALSGAARVHAPSAFTAAALIERGGLDPQRVCVVELGVARVEPVERPLRRTCEPFRLLYAGRLSDLKGTRLFFELAARLLVEEPLLEVDIVGGLPDNKKAERRWRRQWEALMDASTTKRTRWLGWREHRDLVSDLKRADALLIPSYTETFGLMGLEAMSHGLPIVATRVGAMVDYLTLGGGLLVEPGDLEGMLRAVRELMARPDRVCELSRQGSEVVREHYLWADRAAQIERFYRDGACVDGASSRD